MWASELAKKKAIK